MRRCTLHGRENILKRLLIHAGAFNISLIMRAMLGSEKPRELKSRTARLLLRLLERLTSGYRPDGAIESRGRTILALSDSNRLGCRRESNPWS
jgi:hypothetical protein